MEDLDFFKEMEVAIFEEYGYKVSGSRTVFEKGDSCFIRSFTHPDKWFQFIKAMPRRDGIIYLTFEDVVKILKEESYEN